MKNMMKKILCLVLAVVVAATLCGCNIVSQATGEIVDDVKHEIENAISGVISNEVGGLVSNIVGGIKDEFNGLNGSNNNSSSSSADNTTTSPDDSSVESSVNSSIVIDKNGTFDQKDDVALYIHEYGKLPSNYISKKDAEALGWSGGSLEKYAPGKCIGGSRFGNYEELLPEKDGRIYTECDIDTLGKSSRGAKRIVFSNDGLVYYTEDHYESFELLYGKDLI